MHGQNHIKFVKFVFPVHILFTLNLHNCYSNSFLMFSSVPLEKGQNDTAN